MSNKDQELKNKQMKTSKTSPQQTPSQPLKKGVFMIREKGMSFDDYVKAFIEALDKAGLLKPSKPAEKQEQGKEQEPEEKPEEDWFDRMIKHPPVATPREWLDLRFGHLKKKESGDGTSIEQAVVINARSTLIGIPEEYAHIESQCGEWNKDFLYELQLQINHIERHYDLIYVRMIKDKSKREFWFDVTSFFGKL